MPDKAIDLVDEACANSRVQLDSVPEDIDAMQRQKYRLQVEEKALSKEKDKVGGPLIMHPAHTNLACLSCRSGRGRNQRRSCNTRALAVKCKSGIGRDVFCSIPALAESPKVKWGYFSQTEHVHRHLAYLISVMAVSIHKKVPVVAAGFLKSRDTLLHSHLLYTDH